MTEQEEPKKNDSALPFDLWWDRLSPEAKREITLVSHPYIGRFSSIPVRRAKEWQTSAIMPLPEEETMHHPNRTSKLKVEIKLSTARYHEAVEEMLRNLRKHSLDDPNIIDSTATRKD